VRVVNQRTLQLTPTHPDVARALQDCRRAFWSVALFSGVANILMFAAPLYMLQIYDRVLASRSVPTLVALTVCLVGAYAFQGAFDLIRGRIVARASAALDQQLATSVHDSVIQLGIVARQPGEAHQPVRDLDQIRGFLSGGGPIAIVDLPWVPVFLFVCFLINVWLGVLSLAGVLILIGLTFLTERSSRDPSKVLARDTGLRAALIEGSRRNSETAVALGMTPALAKRWNAVNTRYLGAMQRSTDVIGTYSAITKVIRLLLQSLILGVGAYLVIHQELTAGAMMAASIMMGRALAPIETAIGNWRGFVGAREGVRRLSELLSRMPVAKAQTTLPRPQRNLEVEQLTIVTPDRITAVLRDVRFRLAAGEAVGVVGPSGSGKTSLARVLVGIWQPGRGSVRLDGAAIDQWNPTALGRHIGFVSQNVEIFDGTVAENIARMAEAPDSEAVLEAARAAGAHEMIVQLPSGYDTPLGEAGAALSGGQRQRIALARALYGEPFLIVLDEPNANLDAEGEAALAHAIKDAKSRGAIVVLIAHRPSALAVCDKVLVVNGGTQMMFGPRDEIMQRLAPRPAQPVPNVNLKVVGENAGGA
jgi:PrtD family type I secretion system ABC transporter